MRTATLNKMPRPKKEEPSDQVRLPRSIVRRLRRLAGHRLTDVGDLVVKLIEGPLAEDERKMREEMDAEAEQEKPAAKKPKK